MWLAGQSVAGPQVRPLLHPRRFLGRAHADGQPRIPYVVAIKIALELKKAIMDRQPAGHPPVEMEADLFRLMARGYGEESVSRYRFMTQ